MADKQEDFLTRDPVTFEIVRGALYAICEEMKSVIMRTSFSPLLSLSADMSCALLDRQGNVIAQGNDIPVHLGAAKFTALAALDAFPEETWRDGDGVLLNDPYAGGTHLPDMSLVTPVMSDGEVAAFALSRIHWPDIGGIAAGSSSVCDEIIKEGLRVPPIKVLDGGKIREDVLRLILANVRVPEDRFGDFQAALAGHRRATERVAELCRRYGTDAVTQIMRDTQTHSLNIVNKRLSELADMDVSNEAHLDGDGIDPDTRPRVKVNIRKTGTKLVFDFSGSADAVKGPINAPLPVTSSAVFYTVLAFLGGDVAPNSGVYEGVEIIAPEGSIVNAQYPSPVVASNTETSNRLVDLLMGALSKACPEMVSAASYGSACVYTLGGFDTVKNRPYVHYETIGGGMGAINGSDGVNGVRVHMGNTMNLPIESMEASLPIRFHCYELREHSGGGGRFKGGAGVRKILEALADDMEASVLGERTLSAPEGTSGGSPGQVASFRIRRNNGEVLELGAKSGPHVLCKGDRLELETAGGGGWGAE